MNDLNWWVPLRTMFLSIVDTMPPAQQAAVMDMVQAWGRVLQDKGELQASYFCRDLSGEEFPQPKPKSSHLKVVKDG
jgi:hypothetical protein